MSILENNLKALGTRQPQLARSIAAHATTQHPMDDNPKGTPANTLAQQIKQNKNPTIVFFKGVGPQLLHYLSAPHRLTRFIVVFEPELGKLVSFFSRQDLSHLIKAAPIFWLHAQDATSVEYDLSMVSRNPGFSESLDLIAIADDGQEHPLYPALDQAIQSLLTVIHNQLAVLPIDATYGFLNFMANWKRVIETPLLQELHGLFAGKPGIVVSAGPSLSLSLEGLKQAQAGAVIFAVDSVFKKLQEAGIQPHLTGCLERTALTARHFADADTSPAVLVTTPIIHPKTYGAYQGKVVNLPRSQHYLPWIFPEADAQRTGMSSVSHLGLFTLWALGCRPIYLLGQDLAYDPETHRSHYAGYGLDFSKESAPDMGWSFKKTTGNDGQELETDSEWFLFGVLISKMVKQYKMECVNLIPTTHGIKIEGIDRQDPLPVLNGFADTPLDAEFLLKNKIDQFDENKKLAQSKKAQAKLLETAPWIEKTIKEATDTATTILSLLASPVVRMDAATMALFKKLEQNAESLRTQPLSESLLNPLIFGTQVKLIQKSYEMLEEDEKNPLVIRKKLSLALAWQAEIIVRCRMVQETIKSGDSQVTL